MPKIVFHWMYYAFSDGMYGVYTTTKISEVTCPECLERLCHE